MKVWYWLFCLLVILSACATTSNETPPLTKPAEAADHRDSTIKSKVVPKTKEISLFTENGEEHIFLLKDLPLIDKYLQHAGDATLEIARMKLSSFDRIDETSSFFVLQYGCSKDLCSHLFIKKEEKDVQSKLISDFATLKEVKWSTEQQFLSFHFTEPEGDSFTRDTLYVIDVRDLDKMQLITPEENQVSLTHEWPILSTDWVNNDTIAVTIPDVSESSTEAIMSWFEQSQDTRVVKTISFILKK